MPKVVAWTKEQDDWLRAEYSKFRTLTDLPERFKQAYGIERSFCSLRHRANQLNLNKRRCSHTQLQENEINFLKTYPNFNGTRSNFTILFNEKFGSNLSTSVISRLLHNLGITKKPRTQMNRFNTSSELCKWQIVQLYKQGISANEICKKYGCSPMSISRVLNPPTKVRLDITQYTPEDLYNIILRSNKRMCTITVTANEATWIKEKGPIPTDYCVLDLSDNMVNSIDVLRCVPRGLFSTYTRAKRDLEHGNIELNKKILASCELEYTLKQKEKK